MAGRRFPGKSGEPMKTANKTCKEQIHAKGEEG